jgi:hypothetical protein
MKRQADPVNRPGRFVEQQVIAGVTLALWCRPLGRGGDAVWTAILEPTGPQPQAFTRATQQGAIAAALAAKEQQSWLKNAKAAPTPSSRS